MQKLFILVILFTLSLNVKANLSCSNYYGTLEQGQASSPSVIWRSVTIGTGPGAYTLNQYCTGSCPSGVPNTEITPDNPDQCIEPETPTPEECESEGLVLNGFECASQCDNGFTPVIGNTCTDYSEPEECQEVQGYINGEPICANPTCPEGQSYGVYNGSAGCYGGDVPTCSATGNVASYQDSEGGSGWACEPTTELPEPEQPNPTDENSNQSTTDENQTSNNSSTTGTSSTTTSTTSTTTTNADGSRTTTTTGSSTTTSEESNDSNINYRGIDSNDFYERDGKTFSDVFGQFKTDITNTEIVSRGTDFFDVNVSGSCPLWVIPSVWVFPAIPIDMQCSSIMTGTIYPLISAILIATGGFVGFRIAFL